MEVSLDDAANRLSEEFDSSLGELFFWGVTKKACWLVSWAPSLADFKSFSFVAALDYKHVIYDNYNYIDTDYCI